MKRYIGPFLKLLMLLAFLSRIDFVFGQEENVARLNGRTINWSSTPEATSAYAAHNINKASSLGDEIGSARLTLKASPKVFRSKTDLSFILNQGSNYKLEVLDMRGALVSVLAEGDGQAGQNFVFQFKKGDYPSGVYIGRLITKDEVTSARFTLE